MEYLRQEWNNRNINPLTSNEVDCIIIKDVPCSQVEIWNFFENSFRPSPQDPQNQMFVNIVSDERKHRGAEIATPPSDGGTISKQTWRPDLEWHMDQGYKERPPEYIALYSVNIGDDAGNTLFVSSRICDDIPEYFKKHKDTKVKLNINKFENSNHQFGSEIERRFFRKKYRNVEHDSFQIDNKGYYLFYCEAYFELPEMEMLKKKLYNSKRIYSHQWRTGELIIYNNKTTNHKRENGGTTRHLWKIALHNRTQELAPEGGVEPPRPAKDTE